MDGELHGKRRKGDNKKGKGWMIESWCLSFSSLVHYMVRRKAFLSSIPSHSLLCGPSLASLGGYDEEGTLERRWGRKASHLSHSPHPCPSVQDLQWENGMERYGMDGSLVFSRLPRYPSDMTWRPKGMRGMERRRKKEAIQAFFNPSSWTSHYTKSID